MRLKTLENDTFEALARDWHENKKSKDVTPKYGKQILQRMENHIFRHIGGKKAADLKPPELLSLFRFICNMGTIDTAHRLLGYCSEVFRYGVGCGIVESDPTRDLRGLLPERNGEHYPTITYYELPELVEKLGDPECKVVANNTVSGTVTVNNGGTLKGSGTVGGATINAGGHVAPGNSIGTLNVAGNVSFASGSFLDVEVDADGNSDLIHATGTATITGGDVRLMPELTSDTYALNSPYTILTADGGVAGTFDSIAFSIASLFLTPTLSYDATNVYATISRNGTKFADSGLTYNQRQVGKGLDTAFSSNAVLAAVALSSTHSEAQTVLDRFSGELHANIKGDILGREADFSNLLHQQFDHHSYWATYYGNWSERNSDSFNNVESSTQGVAFGRNGAVNDNTVLGIAASYGRTTYTQEAATDNSAKAHIDHYRVGATAAHTIHNLSLKGAVHYGYHSIGFERRVTIPYYAATHTADTNAHSFSSSVEAAYKFYPSVNDSIEPYASIAYGYGHSDGFEEEGGDGFLRVRQDAIIEGRTKLGVRLKQKLAFGDTPANLNINLGWQHKLGSLTPEGRYSIGEGQTFRSQGAAHSRDAVTFEAGLDLFLTDALMMDLFYATDQSKTTASHNVNLGVKWAF